MTLLNILLAVSLTANAFLGWYVYRILNRLLTVSENLDFLVKIVAGYRKHLKQVYEMEMFYGDRTLELLIQHTRDLASDLERYEDVYSLSSLPEFEEEEDDYTTEYSEEEEVNSEAPKAFQGKTIFHQGS